MECGGSRRSGLLTAGGVFSILAGTLEVIGGGTAVALLTSPSVQHALLDPLRLVAFPPVWPVVPTWLIIAGVPLMVLGVMAILGGVSAIRRKSFRQSLAGAICALPSVILSDYLGWLTGVGLTNAALTLLDLGILALIFLSQSKREFGAERKVNGI
jgi:hypothetical protein